MCSCWSGWPSCTGGRGGAEPGPAPGDDPGGTPPMLIGFFNLLRQAGLPVSIPELLTLLEALQAGLVFADREEFYHLSRTRSEEHTSELQSRGQLVCRLLLEQKNPNAQ